MPITIAPGYDMPPRRSAVACRSGVGRTSSEILWTLLWWWHETLILRKAQASTMPEL